MKIILILAKVDNSLRDLHNSLHGTKAKFNTLIFYMYFSVLNNPLHTLTRSTVLYMYLIPLLAETWKIVTKKVCQFFFT